MNDFIKTYSRRAFEEEEAKTTQDAITQAKREIFLDHNNHTIMDATHVLYETFSDTIQQFETLHQNYDAKKNHELKVKCLSRLNQLNKSVATHGGEDAYEALEKLTVKYKDVIEKHFLPSSNTDHHPRGKPPQP